MKEIATARKHAAGRAARKLLDELEAPPAGRLVGPRPRGFHARSPGVLGGKFADARRFWTSHASPATVRKYARAHLPSGFTLEGWGSSGDPSYEELDFSSPTAYLVYTTWKSQNRTIVQADAQVVWLYPRSPQEKVPVATTEIDIKAPGVSRHVTDSAQVAQIIRWFNALPISQPSTVHVSCPFVLTGPGIELEFRSAQGTVLATASAPSGRAGTCSAIGFAIDGKLQTPLTDHFSGPTFVYRVQTLLGVKLLR